MIDRIAHFWAGIVHRYAVLILLAAFVVTIFAFKALGTLGVSTRLEGLMPQGAESVKTLNEALRKTGSFASIQIVAESDDPDTSLQIIKDTKALIDKEEWVESSQYFEDIEVLEQHKLLLLTYEQLVELEDDVNEAYPVIVAKQLSEIFGNEVTFTLRGEGLSGNSNTELDESRVEDIQNSVSVSPQTQQMFQSEDGKTAVLVVWPKAGLDSLTDAKMMIDKSNNVVTALAIKSYGHNAHVGVAGRIANKTAQFDAIIGDLKTGLLWSISLIAILIIWSYGSFAAIPAIFVPLSLGIIWTLAMTALTVGNLNLITVFLALILFGLGIDFGIHNFSRYREERRKGATSLESLEIIIRHTGGASLIAALTTSLGFFSLMLTEFRAFTEFGFIAGMGILLTFVSMYSVFPALVVMMERVGWRADKLPKAKGARMGSFKPLNPFANRKTVIRMTIALMVFSAIFIPQLSFEQNIKNLEAKQPAELVASTKAISRVFSDSHDRAIIVVETQAELVKIDDYFKDLIKRDTETPTIKKVSSLLDFVPANETQIKRLEVIRRLGARAEALQAFDTTKYQASQRYLSVEDLNMSDLPPALRRTYLGTDAEPGFLMYVYNSVSMDDSRTAKQFYDDAAGFEVDGKTYFSASEGFIFVEMIALMKADAIKAITLVVLTTALLIFLFVRNVLATIVIITPPLLGVLLTIGIMGAIGLNLSIMNMVILPSLIGIAVDNSIHIFHRFENEGDHPDIAKIMNTTGRAAVLTTITTLIGFGGMITASMGGLRSMGLLAIIGFLSCLLMTWMLLPVLLQFYHHRVMKRGARRAAS